MPESAPAPNNVSGSFGKLGSTWFQLFTVDPGSHIALSWSTVRQLAQVFSLLTTTVSASLATWISSNEMALASHCAFSSSLIGREAVGDVGLAGAELLETTAGTRGADSDV